MTGVPLELLWASALTALRPSAALLGAGAGRFAHAVIPAAVSGVLLPLLPPHVRARLGSLISDSFGVASRIELVRSDEAAPARLPGVDRPTARASTGSPKDLAAENIRLRHELGELRSAYAQVAIAASKQAEAADRLRYLAYHDALTQLPNRTLLMERLAQALRGAERGRTGVLVMYLDLDRFKTINDTLGHAAGDRVLSEVAGRIAKCMRETDTASRFGGDEFVLVVPTADPAGDAERIGVRLERVIAAPLFIDGAAVTTGVSIGASAYPADGADPADLICIADAAMYRTKTSRRGAGVLSRQAGDWYSDV